MEPGGRPLDGTYLALASQSAADLGIPTNHGRVAGYLP